MSGHQLHVHPAASLHGSLRVPGDKSISHRYAMIGALARGLTSVTHLAPGADVAATIACLRALGVTIETNGHGTMRVHGRGVRGLQPASGAIDAANSGTTMRLLSGIVAGHPFHTRIVGDASLSRRPMRRVIDPLTAMGAHVSSNDGRAPLDIDGGSLTGIAWTPPVPSAQIKSAVLLAGLHAKGTTTVHEPLPTRDHTERMLRGYGVEVRVDGLARSIDGGQQPVAPTGTAVPIPGDPSSAAVWAAAAAALPRSTVQLDGVCLNPDRIGFVAALERLGARIAISNRDEIAGEPVGTLQVSHDEHREARIGAAEVPALIDELPVLAARAALGGRLEVTGAGELRVKESDRITALVNGFRALGATARELPDGFVVEGGKPTGGTADAAGDHRLVMAFTIVGLGASGPTLITGAEAVAVSYPAFESDLAALRR